MKKLLFLVSGFLTLFFLVQCSSAKKAGKASAPPITYENTLTPIIMSNCVPCHIPEKGGFKKPYDNYKSVKTDIDEIIRRIELEPGQRGFMPFKKQAKLPDSVINVFKQWRDTGLKEK